MNKRTVIAKAKKLLVKRQRGTVKRQVISIPNHSFQKEWLQLTDLYVTIDKTPVDEDYFKALL